MTNKIQKIRQEVKKLKSNLIHGACSSQVAMETMCKEEAYNEVLAILDTMQEDPKKCMYSKDNFTDEDRKVLCDGCEEECEYAQKKEYDVCDFCDEKNTCVDPCCVKLVEKQEPITDIDFEQELYKAFGQVKDFTLGMQIAKRFYQMGIQHQEPVSEDLEQEIIRYVGYPEEVDEDISTSMVRKAAHYFANWQKEQMERNRIAHCKSITNEQAELEDGFVSSHIEANHRMPTFLDAIEYGMELQKKEMLKDAIEGFVTAYPYADGITIMFGGKHQDVIGRYKKHEKVKLIIVRED